MKMGFWEKQRAINIASAIVCAGVGYWIWPSWVAMLDAAAVGFNLGAALWITRPIIPMVRAAEQMHVAFHDMADVNDALIHNRVMFHLFGEPKPQDSADEHKPRLH